MQIGNQNQQTNLALDPSALPPPQRSPESAALQGPIHNLPPKSGVFVGREIEDVGRLLAGSGTGAVVGQAAAVHGLGGIGKSELVTQYAHANLNRYPLVWWITADNPENLSLGLAALTRRLHVMATLADAEEWAIGWLQSHNGWLLILDNVEDIGHIRNLLGLVGSTGHVLVTTRRNLGDGQWTRLGLRPLSLGVLDRAASIELLTRLAGSDDVDGADRLATDLGDLPLALDQAGVFISQLGLDFDEYRALLADSFESAARDIGEGSDAERTIATVWQVTMNAVTERSQLAAQILDVLAWLAPDDVPEDLLAPLGSEPLDTVRALSLLSSYSMIIRAGGMVGVHRLVQAVTRHQAGVAGSAESSFELATDLLAAGIPDDPINGVAGWPRWALLLPHIDSALACLAGDHANEPAMLLGDRAATFRQFQGRLREAIGLFETVLADRRRVLGEEHPSTLTSRNNLALAYESVGRLEEAIDLFESVLADQQRVLGEEHPSTLASRNNLAASYQAVGRLVEAIDLYESVLADQRRVLGEEHPFTLASRNNLAASYQAVGRLVEAIDLYESVLVDRRRVLGEEHPDTLA
ncbi:tetratricopeptide repeat protein, partial [Virgisporangium ochraceum]|uniref:tetratricopeptide repeat protein n=1 Tax=Virgisporangium ochraceum TaxID=65505 RepID=UPI00194579EF